MANNSSQKARHLSVVDANSQLDSASELIGRLISIESLQPGHSAQLNRYTELAKISGTIVGAVCGAESWDVRPVVLRAGRLSIYRFTNPAWIIERAKLDHFKVQVVRIGVEKSIYLSSGENQGQAWIERRYFDALLDGTQSNQHAFFSLHPVIQAQNLITLVESTSQKGIVHGHINASNVAVDGDSAYLIDHIFRSVGSNAQQTDIAPEVSAGLGASKQSDIFGLGIVLRTVLGTQLGYDHSALLQKMLAAEPSQRPTFNEIKRAFGLSVEQQSSGSAIKDDRGRIINAGSALPRGKVIQPVEVNLSAAVQPIEVKQIRSIPTDHISKQVPSSAIENKQSVETTSGFGFGLLVLLGLALITGLTLQRSGYLSSSESVTEISEPPAVAAPDASKLSALWFSSQPSLMSEVARLAVKNGDRVAQSVIVSQALSGREVPAVRSGLIATAFDPAWEAQLSESDRRLAIGLATAAIAPDNLVDLPELGTAHAGVVLAMLVQMEPQSGSKELAAIPVGTLAVLPQPYGPAFAALQREGVGSVDEVSAQALAHILRNGLSPELIKIFLAENPLKKLLIILPMLSSKGREAREEVWKVISEHNDLRSFTEWFAQEKAPEWDKVAPEQKLALVSGIVITEGLNQLQIADLITFPSATVRAAAKTALITKLGNSSQKFLEFLLSPSNRLDRGRVLALLTTLMLPEEDATALLMNWFAKNPDAASIASILVSRNGLSETDQLSEQAADYLLKLKFKPTLPQIKALSTHPVPLARTVAYVNLNPIDPKERSLLLNMAKTEQDPKIREAIQAKIKMGDEIRALNQAL